MKRYAVKTKSGYISSFVKDVQMVTSETLRGATFYKRSEALEIAYWFIKKYKDFEFAEIEMV